MKLVTNYFLVYRDYYGNYVTTIRRWFKLEYAKKENDFGSLYLDLPNIYPVGYFQVDGRIEVWRQVGAFAPYLEMDTVWLIRLVRSKYSKGDRYIHILCHDATNIIDRRIVAYSCDTAYSHKNTYADNMMRQIVRENFGSLATDTNRDISAIMSVEADLSTSTAPTLDKSFCRQKVLPLLQDICSESFENNGTYLAFDVVYTPEGSFEFRVFQGARGLDRTGITPGLQKVIFSVDAGNLEYATHSFDHSEEYNYIYCGGRGEGDDRVIATASDSTWIAKSPLNRREDWIDSRDSNSVSQAESDAKARLAEAGPKQKLNGHIVQTSKCLYGVHYFFGDKVTVMHNQMTFDVHLDYVKATVDGKGEPDINIFTRNMDDSEY